MSWALAIAAGITALWAIWEAFVEKNIGFVNVFAGSAAVITGSFRLLQPCVPRN